MFEYALRRLKNSRRKPLLCRLTDMRQLTETMAYNINGILSKYKLLRKVII